MFQTVEVPLEVFMNFNKLRTLTEDIKEIAKALKFSTTLKLSQDETKVSRNTPFHPKSQEEADLCTIYVVNSYYLPYIPLIYLTYYYHTGTLTISCYD